MVNLETNRIVDMIESREGHEVSEWLKGYPNIQVVSRDGSQTYAAAIRSAHPNAMQVSDRFHIIKNLSERAKLCFQKLFPGRVSIPLTAETADRRDIMVMGTKPEKIRLVKQMRAEGRSLDEIRVVTGVSEQSIKKYIAVREEDIPEQKQTVRGREHEEAVEKVNSRAKKVRELKEQGLSINAISEQTSFTYATVKRYLSEDFTPISGHYGKQREGKLEPFRDEVLKMKADGLKYREIHEIITSKGYNGTQDAIRGFVSKERRISRDINAEDRASRELIDKKWLIQLLYKPIEKVKGITQSQLDAVVADCPVAGNIYGLINEFKELFKQKESQMLFSWMKKASELNLPEINAFIAGLQADIHAVENAILTDYNNGLAEGCVNKLKLIKRIMYGRCGFKMLKNKALKLEICS